jgi:hypothetical protein
VVPGALLALLVAAGSASAHGLIERYSLPIPLWLYLAGAGAAVVLSFVVIVPALRRPMAVDAYPRWDVLRHPAGRLLAHPAVLEALRCVGVVLLVLAVVAGLIGRQSPFHNITPVLVWVIFWVGMSFVSALVGDVWALLNPWRTLGPRGDARRVWPAWLGVWPAVLLLLAFSWMELVWTGRDRPRNLALAIVVYSGLTCLGMAVFGREAWLRGGEVFSVVFGVLARFAPSEIRVIDPCVCHACSTGACGQGRAGCVNCLECFERAAPKARQVNLRPPAVGLLVGGPAAPSLVALVVLLLAIVSFDGFSETPAWTAVEAVTVPGPAVPPTLDHAPRWPILTLGLGLAPLVFLGLYAATAWLMARAGAGPRGADLGGGSVARWFVLTLLPIAIAYHVAHYLPFFLVAGQLIIPLASDPLGVGWDLFGTSLYRLDVAIMDAALIWYAAVAAVVAGHVLAVYLAHLTALQAFVDRRLALRSQYPMLALMVGYTMLSLWILAQPVVQPGG